jgi:hypothetical protein
MRRFATPSRGGAAFAEPVFDSIRFNGAKAVTKQTVAPTPKRERITAVVASAYSSSSNALISLSSFGKSLTTILQIISTETLS